LQLNNGDDASTAPDDKEKAAGSFEITMNTSPDGKSKIKFDIDAPRSISENIQGTLNKVMKSVNPRHNSNGDDSNSSGSSIAHQVRAGGGNINDDANYSPTAATAGGGGAHISSRFPIATSELPHFFSMSFMMFLFIYVFTTVRDTKDTLVVSNCGAEAIPFLKLYAVMPCATAFIVIYSKLSNVLDKRSLFYVTLIPFFIFYGVFAFVLFPNRDNIHFPTLAEGLMGGGGGNVGGVTGAAVNLIRYWSFSLYFIVSELWASAGVPLLFWQVSEGYTQSNSTKTKKYCFGYRNACLLTSSIL
jgi:AAA family ATP:ADP antiporter